MSIKQVIIKILKEYAIKENQDSKEYQNYLIWKKLRENPKYQRFLKKIQQDFDGQERRQKQIELLNKIKIELQSSGKFETDDYYDNLFGSKKIKSEKEMDDELDDILKNVDPNELTPVQRLSQIKKGEREPEWQKATEKDAETQKANARKRTVMKQAGTLKLDPKTKLPIDTDLWTDSEWDIYDFKNHPDTYTPIPVGGKIFGHANKNRQRLGVRKEKGSKYGQNTHRNYLDVLGGKKRTNPPLDRGGPDDEYAPL